MHRIYSCDDHLDLAAVPPDLWESRVSRAHAERGAAGRAARARCDVGV